MTSDRGSLYERRSKPCYGIASYLCSIERHQMDQVDCRGPYGKHGKVSTDLLLVVNYYLPLLRTRLEKYLVTSVFPW